MKLSTTTRYGIRALADLCIQPECGEKPIAVSDIARRQDIPVNYLEQLFARLRRGNILKSVRGAQGGYLLARPADEISLAEIINTLEEDITFGSCQTDEGCLKAPTCPTFDLWRRVRSSIYDILDSTTLSDITQKERSLRSAKTVEPLRLEARDRALERIDLEDVEA